MSGLNLFIMSAEDIVRWYEPKPEEEQYIVRVLKDILADNDHEISNKIGKGNYELLE